MNIYELWYRSGPRFNLLLTANCTHQKEIPKTLLFKETLRKLYLKGNPQKAVFEKQSSVKVCAKGNPQKAILSFLTVADMAESSKRKTVNPDTTEPVKKISKDSSAVKSLTLE